MTNDPSIIRTARMISYMIFGIIGVCCLGVAAFMQQQPQPEAFPLKTTDMQARCMSACETVEFVQISDTEVELEFTSHDLVTLNIGDGTINDRPAEICYYRDCTSLASWATQGPKASFQIGGGRVSFHLINDDEVNAYKTDKHRFRK